MAGELCSAPRMAVVSRTADASLFPHFPLLRLFMGLVTLTTLTRAPLTLQNV